MAIPGSSQFDSGQPSPRRWPRLRQQLVLQFASLVVLFAAVSTVFSQNDSAHAVDCNQLAYFFVPAEAGDHFESNPSPDCGSEYSDGTIVEITIFPIPAGELPDLALAAATSPWTQSRSR